MKIKINKSIQSISFAFLMSLILLVFVFSPAVAFDDDMYIDVYEVDPDAYGGPLAIAEWFNSFQCGFPEKPQQFIKDYSEFCWFCRPMNSVIAISQEFAGDVYEEVRGGIISLMAVFFCLWIFIKVVQHIAIFKYQDAASFYTDIGKMSLRVLITVLVLGMGVNFWNYTVLPLASMVFDYGSAAMNVLPQVGAGDMSSPISSIGQKLVGSGENAGGIMAVINAKIMSLIAYGWIMMTVAFASGSFCIPWGQWALFFFGFTLLLFSVFYLLALPLKFVDVVFRFALFLVLLPLYIASWAFPLTKPFSRKGINLLVNVMMNFLIFAIVVTVCTELITQTMSLPDITSNDKDEISELLLNNVVGGWSEFVSVLAYMLFAFVIIHNIENMSSRLSELNVKETASKFSQSTYGGAKQYGAAAGKLTAAGAVVVSKTGKKAKNFAGQTGKQAKEKVSSAVKNSYHRFNKWRGKK